MTVFPRTVISKWFHSPTGLSACVRGVTAARTAAGVLRSMRMLYISPEPIGQHQMLIWCLPDPANENAGIRVGQRELHLLAANVARVRAVRQDVGDIRIDVRRLLDAPVDLQHEVAELPLGPRGSCLRSTSLDAS